MLSVMSVSGMPSCVQFPRGEARALQVRPRLRHQHAQLAALLDGHANHAQRRADARGGQRAGVALRHHGAVLRHEFRAEAADGLVGGALFFVDALRFRRPSPRARAARSPPPAASSKRRFMRSMAQNRSTAVGRVSAMVSQMCGELGAQFSERFGRGVLHAQGDAHGGGDADGRRAANHHVANGAGDFAIVGVSFADQLRRAGGAGRS